MKMLQVCAAMAASLFVGAVVSGDALSATQPRQITTHPTGICQSALPVFDGNIRKRPLAVQNEGTGNAFITCSYPSGEGRFAGNSATTRVWQYMVNISANPVTINCTGVAGTPSASFQVVKSVVVPANSSAAEISWFAADFPGTPLTFPGNGVFSASCLLPPGAGVRQSFVDSVEDIGT